LGLAPFKDVFWTREENSGNPFYSDCMIVSNNTDPNIPWTLNYRYNGYKNVTSKEKDIHRNLFFPELFAVLH